VPLDYAEPRGRKLTIAVSRIKATDRKKRLGILLLNPGGPGGAGVGLPAVVATRSEAKGLAKRFDLIGFDPRGVGESTRLRCKFDESSPPADVTKEAARRLAQQQAKANAACARTDLALTRELTTPNVARDMDRIRAALGEKKLNYLGISWGTALGAHYRSLFGPRVGRMVIDSPVTSDYRWDRMYDDLVAARQRNHLRFAAWIAGHHKVYGLGTTAAEVERTMVRLYTRFAKNPQDLPDLGPIDGPTMLTMMYLTSSLWPDAASGLAAVKKAADTTPPATGGERSEAKKAAEPEEFNVGVQIAITCNEEAGTRDFERWWTRFSERRQRYPLASLPVEIPFSSDSFSDSPTPVCAGWPHPVRPYRLANTGAPLLIVGHAAESVTPGQWAPDLQRVIGGHRHTMDDDGHGSLLFTKQCAPAAESFLATGAAPVRKCRVPLPTPQN
jgi:pimeloyl-ACP methyl ester carboxylesterase